MDSTSKSEAQAHQAVTGRIAGDEAPLQVRMLVPVDCTALGDAVLETAASMARLMNAEVHLIAVVPEHERVTVQPLAASESNYDGAVWSPTGGPQPAVSEWGDQALAAERSAAEDYLHHAAERFAGVPVTTDVLLRKSVAEAIIDYARGCDINLIAMATHGRRRLAQVLLGSVAADVVRSGVAPVLLVKPRAE